MRLLLVLSFTLAACSHHDKAKTTTNSVADVRAKGSTYVALAASTPGLIDSHGFPADDECDSVQRACFRFVGGATVDYAAAHDPDTGRWFRDSGHTCGPADGSSASTMSRDMLEAIGLCLWQAADTALAQSTLDYASAHKGIMGDGPDDLTQMGPVLEYLYKSTVAKAAGTPLPARPSDPNPDNTVQSTSLTSTVLTGFVAHLTEVGIYWDGLMQGGVTDIEMQILKDQAARQPRNALYQALLHKYTDGDQSAAIALAMDESLFPKDRLPTSCDHKASYLWERDDGADWQPDPNTPAPSCKTWAGTDLVFLAAVIADELRGDKAPAN